MKQKSLNVFCCCKKLVLILAIICGRVFEFLKISPFKVFKKELWTFVMAVETGIPFHQW